MSSISYRPAKPEDIAFIMSSWKRSWRQSPWAGTIRNDQYYDVQQATIEGLVLRGATFEVACYTNQPDVILGWVCHEVDSDGICVIHYVYVKETYHALGIGKTLVARSPGKQPGIYSHRYRQVTDACEKKPGTKFWTHVPESARRK